MALFEINDALDNGCTVSVDVADVAEVRAVSLYECKDGSVLFKQDRGANEFQAARITRYHNGHLYTTQTYDQVVNRWLKASGATPLT